MKKRKIWKFILLALLIAVVIFIIRLAISTKDYLETLEAEKASAPGNAEQYALDKVDPLENSPLNGKRILFLGSSVTYGDASQGCSFADYIGKRNGVEVVKEAVGGTTLVDDGSIMTIITGKSYVERLKNVDKNQKFDMVVVQLSTNDATMNKTLGQISTSENMEDFDTKTVTGAIEYIVAYCGEVWGCPVVFYMGSYYESEAYAAMVVRLHELSDKWDITVADLYSDKEFNDIEEERYELYMYDQIHPTKAGYLEWWTPFIENALYDVVG